jgi:serine acetyltransferase
MNSCIYTHMNVGNSDLIGAYPKIKGDVQIPDNTVIGSNAILLYPFSFAPGTFIAAGSVVKGHYTQTCMLIGNPARPTLLRPEQKPRIGTANS